MASIGRGWRPGIGAERIMLDFIRTKLQNLSWESFIMLGSTLVTFFIAAIISFLFQYSRYSKELSFTGFLKHCFPASGWASKSSMIDVFMYFAGKVIRTVLSIGDAIVAIAVSSAIAAALAWAFPGHKPAEAGYITLIVLSIALFVFSDFANFFTHYLQHKVNFLWELHKVHHSATFLSPLTTARMHPLGD